MGISNGTLSKWISDYQTHGTDAYPGRGRLVPQEEEIRRLKRDLARAEMERDILKKAIAFFAKAEK